MMNAHGPDAQMGIWYMFMVVILLFWLVTGFVAAGLLEAAWKSRWRLLAASVLLIWVAAISWSSVRYYNGGRALFDASASSTLPARLRELTSYDGIQSGYELDNRIASNPNTPIDALRLLHGRPDQVGTEMCLARNPNTPDDILIELANRKDDWSQYITDSLKRNPRYNEVFGNHD